jgi:transcriptional regulator with XRE-family HTH domain
MSTVRESDISRKSRDAVELGRRLRAARETAELSIRRLAERIGIHHANLARIESGEVAQPAPEILQRLASALEIDPADLFALAGYQIPEGLPALPAYLRARYRMPPEAAAQLTEFFDYLSTRFEIKDAEDDSERSARDSKRPTA